MAETKRSKLVWLEIARTNVRKVSAELHLARVKGYSAERVRETEAMLGRYLDELWAAQEAVRNGQ